MRKKIFCNVRLRLHENFFNTSLLYNLTVIYNGNLTAGITHNFHLVSNHYNRQVHFLLNLANQIKNCMRCLRIQCTGSFIAEQNVRLVGKSTGNCDTLFLTSRKRRNRSINSVCKPYKFKHLNNSCFYLVPANPAYFHRIGNIFASCPGTEQIKILKNHADSASPLNQIFFRKIVNTFITIPDFSRIRFFKQTDKPHKSRFSCAAFSNYTKNFIRRNRQTHILNSLYDQTVLAMIGFLQIF